MIQKVCRLLLGIDMNVNAWESTYILQTWFTSYVDRQKDELTMQPQTASLMSKIVFLVELVIDLTSILFRDGIFIWLVSLQKQIGKLVEKLETKAFFWEMYKGSIERGSRIKCSTFNFCFFWNS